MDVIKPFIEQVVYPAMEKKRGNRVRKNITELQGFESCLPVQVREVQKERLKKLLLHCITEVPAYHDQAALREEVIDDPAATLLKFPVLTKAEFRKNPELFLKQKADPSLLIANQTGGSSGEPMKFYIDRTTVEYYEAARWRGLSWWGITPGSRSVMIWGNPIELNANRQIKYRLKERWLKNKMLLPAYNLNPDSIGQYCMQADRFKPEYFYGFATALYTFARMMLARNIRLRTNLKAVVSTAEMLHEHQRQTIEKAFCCAVVNEYGARDGGILAYECPEKSMHISAENVIMEVVDEKTFQPVPSGQPGLLLITDLNNFSQPRIRYLLGDRVALGDEICACGRGLPLLKTVEGREDAMLVKKDGSFVHGLAFGHIARGLDGIKQFQIIQHDLEHATIRIVPEQGKDKGDIDRFVNKTGEFLPGCEFELLVVEEIPAGPSGKQRYAIREFEV